MTLEFSDWSRQLLEHTERTLDERLPEVDGAPSTLHTAMRYVVLGGGKRIRPLLTFAAGEFSNAPIDRVTTAACAVELIHAYSLVHDDLPCMDNDVLRRGKPTCHVAFGEATALLVGDSLQSLAFELLATETLTYNPSRQIEMFRVLATSSGPYGMAGGQAIDLANVGRDISLTELETMHHYKTGALIHAAVLLGALCGEPMNIAQYDKLDRYAHCIGLAFQVVDDILDATASSNQLGKTAGKDAEHHKPTYVSLMGIAKAQEFARNLHTQAMEALINMPRNRRLAELADRILQRTF